MKIFDFITQFKNSSNKIYIIEKYKSYILSRFLLLGFLFAFIGYFCIEDKHFLESFTSSLKMITFDPPDGYKSYNIVFPIALILIGFVIFYSITTTFFKEIINNKITKSIRENEHTVLFGLSDINRAFLEDENNSDKNIIIVEKDKDNAFIEEFRNKGFGVVIDDIINSTLDPEDYKNLKYSIISLGDDKLNIDFAINLINILSNFNNNLAKLLVIHIENDELKELFNLF
jgi:hypothetical protein